MNRLLLAVAVLAFGCSAPTAPAELDPVFIVMCSDPDPEEPHHPCCTGFAQGEQVITASHCVPGDAAELVSNRQWLDTANASQVGAVVARDEARDLVWLTAELDGPGLPKGGPIVSGDKVRALTRSGVKAGRVGARTGIGWLSTMDTRFGDCGSAVVDAAGKAVGMVYGCLTALSGDAKQCDQSSALVTELPR